MRPAIQSPCANQSSRRNTMKVKLYTGIPLIVVTTWRLSEYSFDGSDKFGDESLIFRAKAEANLMFAQAAFRNVPSQEPHQLGGYGQVARKRLVLIGLWNDLDIGSK